MKRRFLLIMLLAAMFAPLAMQAQVLMEAPRALKHQVVKQTPQTREAGWLQYDNGTLAKNLGSGSAAYWTFGPMYPSSMLGNNNTLSKVSFYETSYMITDVTISIYSGGDTEPGTLLYTEDVTPSGNSGFHEVELAEAVTIDPTQNLWIITRVGGTYPMPLCQSTETNNDWVNNGGWGHLSTMWQSGYGFMIRGYVEYIDPASCPKPTQLAASDITLNTATLTWNGEASSYQIVYSSTEGFDPDSATPLDVTETTYKLSSLTDGTTYYAYVRANCEGSYSPWSSMATFTTISACAVPYDLTASDITANSANISWEGWQDSYTLRYKSVVLYEDFENGLPSNWTTIDNDGDGNDWYWAEMSEDYCHSGKGLVTSASYISSGPLTPDNWLITPQIELQGTMSVWLRAQDPSYAEEHYAIYLSTTGKTIDDFTITLVSESYDLTGEYIEVTADLSAYAGQQGYIAIRHFNCSDWFRINVDDFLIEANNNAWTTVNNVTSPYPLEGLTEETTYIFEIQGTCPGGTTEWVSSNFTTLPLCQAPVLTLEDVTTTTATISWTGEARAYSVKLNDELVAENITESTYTFNNLDPGTYYIVEVQSNCGDTGTSEWATVTIFTPCLAFDLPYTYGFEDVMDEVSDFVCWDYMSANEENGIGVSYEDDTNSNIVFYFSSYYEADAYAQILISPELNAEEGVTVEFEYKPLTTNYGNEVFVVGYSTTTNDEFIWGDVIEADNADEWTLFSATYPAGTKYVAVYYLSEYLTYLFLDNFSFTVPSSGITQSTELAAGWNWFSTYIAGEPIDLLQALETSLGENGIMINNGKINTEYDEEWGWFGDLDDVGITNAQMYTIKTNAACTVTLEGMPANPAECKITIKPGWNWIGFPCAEKVAIEDAFANFEANQGDILNNGKFTTEYDEEWGWFGDITTMEPGKGYKYKSTSTETKDLYFSTGSKARRTINLPKGMLKKQVFNKEVIEVIDNNKVTKK